MSSLSNKKHLKFILTLGTSSFDEKGSDQIILEGLRASIEVNKAGWQQMGTLRARIYGMSQSDMTAATRLQWKPQEAIPNTIQVFAIDGDVTTLVYAGNVVNAWADYQSMPDVFFNVQAQTALFSQLRPAPPISVKGTVSVASIMSQLAATMGLNFEKNGVNVSITDPYIPNTALEQAKSLATAANIQLYIDDRVMAITPQNVPRNNIIPVLSATSGLVGYPTFDGVGLNFQTLFNPAVVFGGGIQVQSDLQQANGLWIVTSVSHRLESEKPGGAWFSTIRANANGLAITK
jgi:hypothetical protein